MAAARLSVMVVVASLHAQTPTATPPLVPPAATLQPGSGMTDRFDEHFQKYAKRFFGPGFDWRLFKAQGMAESNLNPTARSGAGARGLMQLMPRTHQEVRSKNPELRLVNDLELNIAAGIAYDRQLWLLWDGSLHAGHMREFMLASYNAGRSTLLRAQEVAISEALDARIWPSIRQVAPKVPRWRSDETLSYVDRIFLNLGRMDRHGQVVK
jgi:membrane-bound lytic murein transglycosylase MltF